MAAPSPRSPSQLRSTLDRVLVHDIKNMSFRLRLLLSNLDEHWDDPEFRKTVRELLASTVERLDGIVDRFSAHEDAVLIKVALDLNSVIREVAWGRSRRGGAGQRAAAQPTLSRSARFRGSGATRTTSATPSRACSRTRSRRRARGQGPRPQLHRRPRASSPRVLVEIIDNGSGMTPEFLRDRLFKPFETTKPQGVGLGLATASQIVRFHDGDDQRPASSHPGGGTLVRLSFPAIPAEPA